MQRLVYRIILHKVMQGDRPESFVFPYSSLGLKVFVSDGTIACHIRTNVSLGSISLSTNKASLADKYMYETENRQEPWRSGATGEMCSTDEINERLFSREVCGSASEVHQSEVEVLSSESCRTRCALLKLRQMVEALMSKILKNTTMYVMLNSISVLLKEKNATARY